MKFKIKSQIIFFLFLIFILISFVDAYQINTASKQDTIIRDISGSHIITKNGDLESRIWMSFITVSDYYSKHQNVTIYFSPWEDNNNKPVTDISIAICKSGFAISSNYDTGFASGCNKSYNYRRSELNRSRPFFNKQGNTELINYTEYAITFIVENTSQAQSFIFLINYTLPSFVFKQGDYSVAWLGLENMNNISLKNIIVLPSKDDVPRLLPNAKDIRRVIYNKNGKIFQRWAFIFEGDEDIIIEYWNDKEIKNNKIKLQIIYIIFGALLGFVITLLGSLFIPFDKLSSWRNTKSFVGNKKNKKYHKMNCIYVKKIINQETFPDKESAEKNKYKPCEICNRKD